MKSHVVIFNRRALPATDGWIHIVPKGELPNQEAGIMQVLDDTSLDSILNGIAQDKNRLGDKWPGVYAGREHFIYQPDQDSAALAWFKDFQKRPDGIWAKEDGLTSLGQEAVQNRLYKFTSFVADRGDLQKIDGHADTALPRYRVLKIETVGFTNQANGQELLTPITNRSAGGPPASSQLQPKQHAGEPPALLCPDFKTTFADAGALAANQNQPANKMKNIATKLGLTAEAGEEAILAEITRRLDRADIAPAALATLQNRLGALQAENQTLLNEQVDGILADHKLTDPKVVNRLRPILAPLPNRIERIAFLAELGLKPDNRENRATRVLNRGGNQTATVTEPEDEQSLTRKIQNRAGELQAAGMKFDPAWKQAQREILNPR